LYQTQFRNAADGIRVIVWHLFIGGRKNYTLRSFLLYAFQIVYHSIQLAAFTFMAFGIMRLKLFWTPHMCLMTSLLASRHVSGADSIDIQTVRILNVKAFFESRGDRSGNMGDGPLEQTAWVIYAP
jgi:Q-cell neuroblast polarisation